ncbi:MAG: sigma-70 family RNA polymerase sigma factor [Solirubrobacterales bacterium]|nr:sigma-70 family RNA polymerase sigma factor [Solirubrobacterales bacterium]
MEARTETLEPSQGRASAPAGEAAPGRRPFQAFLDEHRGPVLGYLRSMVGAVDADDCFQETFLAALRAWGAQDSEGSRAWVMRIAHNKAVDHHRSRARRPEPRDELPEVSSEDAQPDDELWARVGSLPDGQRSAVGLRYVAGLSHREVGVALGCSEAAARRRVADGLSRLRKQIHEG